MSAYSQQTAHKTRHGTFTQCPPGSLVSGGLVQGKTTLSIADRDSNLDLPVIGSQVQDEIGGLEINSVHNNAETCCGEEKCKEVLYRAYVISRVTETRTCDRRETRKVEEDMRMRLLRRILAVNRREGLGLRMLGYLG
uniref:Uncharacterized protein n=1 Tax=Timema cristinae TaxID=61476 RepID=A0A7R9CSC1_TIMCR|nr:unnamed protein product [Timema cristinae]